MCFSASASFGAGIILSAITVGTIKKTEEPYQIYFSFIPLIFCIQQITEGLLWLSLTDLAFTPLQQPTTYVFLFFAQVVWPWWLPYSILQLEQDKTRKKFIRILFIMGALVSLYLASCLVLYPVEAKIISYHITYKQDYPIRFGGYGDFIYSMATILPALISSIKRMWILGAVISISYLITMLFYSDYVISVWCFFASVISFTVLLLLVAMKNSNERRTAHSKRRLHA